MSIMKIPFSTKSNYVRAVITKLKRENKFHVEENEQVIEIEDFFLTLFDIIDKERKGRNNNE